MDVTNRELLGVYSEQQARLFLESGDSASSSMFLAQEENDTSCEKLLEEWAVPRVSNLNQSEPEDMLQRMINPNEVYSSRGTAETASETDSGISDDQRPDSPQHSDPGRDPDSSPSTIYQVAYGVSVLDSVKTEESASSKDLVSVELGGWNTQMLVPEACIVDSAAGFSSSVRRPPSVTDSDTDITDSQMHFLDLTLTEEEERLLNQEGIVLPSNLPLTKAEERILKKVRRKIRNKQSAQESRRRKKEYIDGLENRVSVCTVQNQELQKQVLQLEHHNVSLLSQLRRLQSLIKQTSNKAAQTSTCIMILTCSLVLLIFPSYKLFRLDTPVNQQGYKPTGVISRTILTDLESYRISDFAENSVSGVVESVELQEDAILSVNNLVPDSQHQPIIRVNRSGLLAKADISRGNRLEDSQLQKTIRNSSSGSQPDLSNSSTAVPISELHHRQIPADISTPAGQESRAASVKLGHADEM
ncbi:LOW QUALITY PROTEIN: cyclic AMP-responsive element-binding protein 3-like protein 4 [Heterodontus francisci]|uniref:LOW QUALITY PROTEIN: cyclic AMP-responsive element-binding protein 3-like protein 4 n=1 Tax=Heterodontus francisci TaxID=7792 RepID=UPI00355C6701